MLGAPVTVTVSKEELTNGIVRVTAPEISGYTVYDEWEQEFQLDAGNTNNIYFYYISSDDRITYSITYYLMDNGRYRPENTIALSGVPGARGESVRLTDMIAAYQSYVQTAYRCMRALREAAQR